MNRKGNLQAFAARIRRRNRREWIAASLVAVGFSFVAATWGDWLGRLCAIEIVAAALYASWRLHRDGRVLITTGDLEDAVSCRRALAREMKRQAGLLERAATWYVAPLAAGWFGLLLTFARRNEVTVSFALYASAGLVFVWLVVRLNGAAARKLTAEIRGIQITCVTLERD